MEQLDGSNPERPPIDVQLEALGYVSHGISEQAYVGAASSGLDRRGEGL